MDKALSISQLLKSSYSYLVDFLALLGVYFIPSLSHLTGIPLYLLEPMRVFIILALLHTNKTNAYILALTLPLFSLIIASHPYFLKSIIISIELALNVYLFHFFVQKKITQYSSVVLSVISSKLVYYLLKFILIQTLLIQSELISTPVYIQLIMTFVFGLYTLVIIKIRKKDKEIRN